MRIGQGARNRCAGQQPESLGGVGEISVVGGEVEGRGGGEEGKLRAVCSIVVQYAKHLAHTPGDIGWKPTLQLPQEGLYIGGLDTL